MRQQIISSIYALALLVGVGKPFVYWFYHPELSQMQVWLNTLLSWTVACLVILATYLIDRKGKA